MVVKKAGGIAGAILAGVAALALASPASAHPDKSPSQAYCEALPKQEADLEIEREMPNLPKDWQSFATTSANWLAVATLYGTTECIDLAWMGETSNFETFKDKRLVGYNWVGYEAFGYTLIDRAGTGTVIEIGARPHFSPDGYMMAALDYSESGYGGLSGFAVWMVYDGGVQLSYLTRVLPADYTDWRLDRWEGDTCIHISAIPYERLEDNWEDMSKVERDSFVAGGPDGWGIQPGSTCPTYD